MNDLDKLVDQVIWSATTFGTGIRTEGLIDHIKKELEEIRKCPNDIEEWIDIIILGFDGAWRCLDPECRIPYSAALAVLSTLNEKREKNKKRVWPDWRTVPEGKAIEHIRTEGS